MVNSMIGDYLKVIAMLLLVFIGHSLAFNDEVEQQQINCESATFAYDNNLECKDDDHE